jgi:ribosomal protein S1
MNPKELSVILCERSEIRSFIETHHYSKSINGVKSTFCFKILFKERLVGAILFGQLSTTAWKKFSSVEEEVLELRRLVLVDAAKKNSESRVISKAIKQIKKESSTVKFIVSYADPNYGHTGVIYRASNFKFVGMSGKDKGFVDTETGKLYHSRALRTKYKGEYKPFVLRLREKLDKGLLKPIDLKPKYCYVYAL